MDDLVAAGIEEVKWTVRVIEALGTLQLLPVGYEKQLCAAIAGALERGGIPFEREVSLGNRRRIDFLCAAGVGIEVKKGSPNRRALVGQARRYCASDRVRTLVLVVEGNLAWDTEILDDKPVFCVALNANWGMAV